MTGATNENIMAILTMIDRGSRLLRRQHAKGLFIKLSLLQDVLEIGSLRRTFLGLQQDRVLHSRLQCRLDRALISRPQQVLDERALVVVLRTVNEAEFLGLSYGFRPRRTSITFWRSCVDSTRNEHKNIALLLVLKI